MLDLLNGKLGEVGIAEVVSAIHVGASKRLGDDMNLRGGTIGTELRQILSRENVENFDKDNTAG